MGQSSPHPFAQPDLHAFAALRSAAGLYLLISLFVRGLPRSTTEESVTALFAQYGVVRNITVARDIFSGDCKGFATVDMEGHEARAAMSALDGSEIGGSLIRVGPNRPKPGRSGKRR